MSSSKIDLLRRSSSGGIAKKLNRLAHIIEEKGRDGAVVAFSGGVDSSTLAALCHDLLGKRVVAATARSPTYPDEELEDAMKTAGEIGIKHYVVETDELSNDDFARNPENRCYYCKNELLDRLEGLAHKLGFRAVFEGTNVSDLSGHRPGFNAVGEHNNVFSPWVDSEFTKEEIRAVARKLGLSIHDKPSLACLASRIPFDERITKERLERIDKAEKYVKGVSRVQQVRVRDHDGLARIEVGRDERDLLLKVEIMDQIARRLRELGFSFITMDIEGYRTGSMTATVQGLEKK